MGRPLLAACWWSRRRSLLSAGATAVPALRRGSRHDKAMVRRSCARILDKYLDDETVPALVDAPDDEDTGVVGAALHTLACDGCKEGECRPGEALWVAKALRLLGLADPDLRAAAIDALGKVATTGPTWRPRCGGRLTPTSTRGCAAWPAASPPCRPWRGAAPRPAGHGGEQRAATAGRAGRRAVVAGVTASRYRGVRQADHEEGPVNVRKTRGMLYKIARVLGDYQAVKSGRVGRRVARRAAGRATGRGLGKIFR